MDRLSLVRRRHHHQRLAGDPLARAADVVDWLGAVQAQEYAEAKWSLGMRMAGGDDADVEAAFDRGEILRTHVLRPTWHFVTPADIRWMLSLTGPRIVARNDAAYRAVGLSAAVLGRGLGLLARELGDGRPRTRAELAERLAADGIAADGTRLAHLMMHAELEQVLCSGPRRGRQQTYALLDDRAPAAAAAPTRERALAELTRRYFTSHGPAGVHDFAWWSGLTVTDARAGLELAGDLLEQVEGDDDPPRFAAPGAPTDPPAAACLLLPTYDEAVIAYREPRPVLTGEPPRNGRLGRAIMIGGRLAGSWRRLLSGGDVVVQATLASPLDAGEGAALESAVARFGRFLGLAAQLELSAVRR
jgi:hypothetical protein